MSGPTTPPPGFPGGGEPQEGGFPPPQSAPPFQPVQPGGFSPSPMPPPGPPAGPPPYGGPPVAGKPTNGNAIASLILGICSILLSCGLVTGIPAIIYGRKAKAEIAAGNGSGDGLATAGIVTGIIGTVISSLGILIIIVAIIASAAGN